MSDKTNGNISLCCGEKMERAEPSIYMCLEPLVYRCLCGKEWQRMIGEKDDDIYWINFDG